jgi:hypothetical protein
MSVEERAKEFQEMLSSGGYSGKYDDECISVFNEYITELLQKLEALEAENYVLTSAYFKLADLYDEVTTQPRGE